MTTENDKESLQIKYLKEQVQRLVGELHSKRQECERTRREVERWKGIAEHEHRSWVQTHDALNRVWQEAQAVFEANEAMPLHRELAVKHAEVVQLHKRLTRRRELTRRAVEEVVSARQEKRDLDQTVEQLKERLDQVERSRTEAADRAQEIIGQRDHQLRQFKGWCDRWIKGEVGAMEVIATMTMMLGCDLTLEPTLLDRRKAVQEAKNHSVLQELSNQLGFIEVLLNAEGVMRTGTHAKQVQDYIQLIKGQQAAREEEVDG